MWNDHCGWPLQGCIYWDRGGTVTFGPLYKALIRVVSLLGTLAKLEELRIKYVVKIGGTKVCDDKVVEPLTKLRRVKKVNIPGDMEEEYAAYLVTAMEKPKKAENSGF